MHSLITLTCGVPGHPELPCPVCAAPPDVDGAYLGIQGPAEWPVHVWRTGRTWLPTHRPRDQSEQAMPALGPIGSVQLRTAVEAYERIPFVPFGTVSLAPVKPRAWDPVDPEPEITTRSAVMAPVPPAVAKLIRQAREAGFEVRAGYARSKVRAVRIGTYRTSETWSVQGRGPALFTAVYERNPDGKTGWKWDRISCSLAGTTFPYASRTDLDAWLATAGAPGDLWRHAILVRERDKAAKAKSRPAARKAAEDGG